MAFIGESKRDTNSPWLLYVCLTAQECRLLLNEVINLENRLVRNLDYYQGLLEGGDATDKQTDKLEEVRGKLETVGNIRTVMDEMIGLQQKGGDA